jgi:AcrR family transcriptional regulator
VGTEASLVASQWRRRENDDVTAEPTPARLPPEQRREQILQSAIRLFEDRPHTSVSTSEIAAAAGVARPLIHHYFGTRQELYIEVLRRLYFIPPIEPAELPGATLEERAGHLVDRWLDGVAWRPNIWLTFTASGGPGADPAVASVLREADELVAQRLIDALELGGSAPAERLLPLVIAWGGLAKGSIHQWLAEKTLTKDDVRTVLVATLMTILGVASDQR